MPMIAITTSNSTSVKPATACRGLSPRPNLPRIVNDEVEN